MTQAELVPLTKAELTDWLAGADISDADDTDEINYDQALRILQATDVDAVLADDQLRKSDTLVGQTFVITGVSWRKSTMNENGPGRYALLTCVDGNGEQFLTSCGATKVVLQVRKAELEGWLPWAVQLDAVSTASGRTMLQLIAPEKDF